MTDAPLIAITGGTGFVGGHVITAALAAGYRVRALARNPLKLNNLSHPRLTIFKGALGDNDAGFIEGADVILHMAGLIKARNRAAFDAVNVTASADLAKTCNDSRIERFVLLSSMAARAPELSPYAASKRAGEDAVEDAYSGPLSVIRAPAVFGPGDEATKPIISAIDRGFLPAPGGRGWRERYLSLVAVQDLANDLITRAVKGDYDGQTVSPATVGQITWPEFAQMASEAVGKPVKAVPIPLSVLYPVAAVTSALSLSFGRGHLTLGKLREFLYDDWRSETLIQSDTSMADRLSQTLAAYRSDTKS
ncbi:NAD-dependent epimerase/dehydratase family protein [Fretibacter rubidus]|uniref:NAD-dependent epimerase/dehydratase family protein n=1 Tax=Fretibacter rubidus TaxID=570162 RepID=UPI00352ACE4C